ncbi:MAG: PQQ-binding-like beta-propeller repeat protein [Candidatus Bathyarchaeia archaeon]
MQRFLRKASVLLIALFLISSAGFIYQAKALGAAHEQIYTTNGSYNGIFYQIVDAGTNYVYQQGYDLADYNCLISPPSINLKFVISTIPSNYTYLYTEEWASNGAEMIDTGIAFYNSSWVMPLISNLYHFEVHVSSPAPTPSPSPTPTSSPSPSPSASPSPTPTPMPLMLSADTTYSSNWANYHHDAGQTGRADNYPLSSSHNILWSTSTPAGVGRSPVLYGSYVYALGGGEGGSMNCYDALTGDLVWEFDFAGHGNVQSSPIAVDGRVYFGTYQGLYCMNASTGTVLWHNKVFTGNEFSTPAYYNGCVYSITSDGLVCYNATTGADIWDQLYYGSYSPLLVTNNLIFYADSGTINVHDASTGLELPFSSMPVGGNGEYASVTVDNGKLFVVNRTDVNTVDCINIKNGALIWATPIEDADQEASIAVSNGLVLVPIYTYLTNNVLVALNETTGASVWNCSDASFVGYHSSPAVANGKVFVVSGDANGRLFAINEAAGTVAWTVVGSATDGGSESDPAIYQGVVYFTGVDGMMYAIGNPTSSPTSTPNGGGGGGGGGGSGGTGGNAGGGGGTNPIQKLVDALKKIPAWALWALLAVLLIAGIAGVLKGNKHSKIPSRSFNPQFMGV